MKILFALRLYTGLEDSMINGSWEPKGVPTIYKLLEGLDKNHDIKVLLLHKEPGKMQYSKYRETRDKDVKFKEFKNTFTIITSLKNKGVGIYIFQKVLEELAHLIKIILYIHKEKPDLVYIDNANVWSAGFIARAFKIPVVLRLLGLYPYIRKLASQKLRIREKILKWCFRAPYSLVINTKDGSGKSSDLKKILNNKTNYKLLLNGVDIPLSSELHQNKYDINRKILSKGIDRNSLTCLFIGKLETYKGCVTFVESIIQACNKGLNVHGIIIGEGSQKKKLHNLINKSNLADHFTILGGLSHKEIFRYHKLCDLYISLNHFGNLSNSNLEAIKIGQVIILPKNLLPETDREDVKLLGEDGILWVENPYDVKGLINHIEAIYNDRTMLDKYSKNIKNRAKLIPTWNERINKEALLLQNIVSGNR